MPGGKGKKDIKNKKFHFSIFFFFIFIFSLYPSDFSDAAYAVLPTYSAQWAVVLPREHRGEKKKGRRKTEKVFVFCYYKVTIYFRRPPPLSFKGEKQTFSFFFLFLSFFIFPPSIAMPPMPPGGILPALHTPSNIFVCPTPK